ncbi:hypothetical protein GCM10020295_52140 [Streptomyces cinereospinus]
MMSPDGIGHLLRGLREQAGRTRRDQAGHLERTSGRFVDPENIKRWETEKRLPIPDWHDVIAEGYGVPVEEVRRAVAASRRYRTLVSTSVSLDDQEGFPPWSDAHSSASRYWPLGSPPSHGDGSRRHWPVRTWTAK